MQVRTRDGTSRIGRAHAQTGRVCYATMRKRLSPVISQPSNLANKPLAFTHTSDPGRFPGEDCVALGSQPLVSDQGRGGPFAQHDQQALLNKFAPGHLGGR